jgi:hypothetical protein
MEITCKGLDEQFLPLAQPCASSLPPLRTVKNPYLSGTLAQSIASALQDFVGRRVTGTVALRNLFLEESRPSGPIQETVRHLLQRDSSPIIL